MSLAITDRSSLIHQLQECCQNPTESGVLALLIIDLLEFSRINAVYGFDVGNSVLEQTAQRLRASGFKNSLIFRIGNDEFALILRSVKDPRLLSLAANKVLRTLSYPFVFDQEMVRLEAVIGMAVYSDSNQSAKDFFCRAESNLHEARAQNKRFLPYEAGDLKNSHDWRFESLLHQAVSANTLSLYYQPKIHLQSGIASHAEALARWEHPELGLVSPLRFVPLLEKTGGIADMTKWAIHTALRESAQWQMQKPEQSGAVAVNVSSQVLEDPEFPEVVRSALSIWGTDPANLTLEITEGALVQEEHSSYRSIFRLKDLGLRISIDDFGTGYSCLSYFKSIPADELKIDQSFVTNMRTDKDDEHLTRVIIDLAHRFNMSVVAEGVEDVETLQSLKSFGCDYAQGFYISKPVPQDEFCRWLENQKL